MRKQIANRLGAAHIRDTVQQFVAGEIDRHQAMESLQIGKSQLYELRTSYLVAHDGYVKRPGRAIDPFAADWIGQFYAYYQWQTGARSRDIVSIFPTHVMCAAYPGLHDLDLSLAVERMSDKVT